MIIFNFDDMVSRDSNRTMWGFILWFDLQAKALVDGPKLVGVRSKSAPGGGGQRCRQISGAFAALNLPTPTLPAGQ